MISKENIRGENEAAVENAPDLLCRISMDRWTA